MRAHIGRQPREHILGGSNSTVSPGVTTSRLRPPPLTALPSRA